MTQRVAPSFKVSGNKDFSLAIVTDSHLAKFTAVFQGREKEGREESRWWLHPDFRGEKGKSWFLTRSWFNEWYKISSSFHTLLTAAKQENKEKGDKTECWICIQKTESSIHLLNGTNPAGPANEEWGRDSCRTQVPKSMVCLQRKRNKAVMWFTSMYWVKSKFYDLAWKRGAGEVFSFVSFEGRLQQPEQFSAWHQPQVKELNSWYRNQLIKN